MLSLFRLKIYMLAFLYYKSLLLVSAILNIVLFFIGFSFSTVLTIKLILLGFYFLRFLDIQSKRELIFYQNFGLSIVHLFFLSFVFDVILTFLIRWLFFLWS
ncbi:hypothetical protein D2V05_07570 [Flagellimonas pelagia]|uniref:Uncharacterized protein n=1 Tax=Flagellimonas pelagia TaxID=2306998 RepID=A0A3A1NIK3_9FLAO|nr:hypothetical protein D2V05_07570 [Allomuricauda maritima]